MGVRQGFVYFVCGSTGSSTAFWEIVPIAQNNTGGDADCRLAVQLMASTANPFRVTQQGVPCSRQ